MATGSHTPSSPDPYLPKNTIVVMPKSPPMNRNVLWLVFWGVGLVMGLFLRSLLDGPAEPPAQALSLPAIAQANGAVPTFEVKVNAILQLPTATPTAKPTIPATAKPSSITPTINDCGAAEPGKVCQVPFPPPPSPTPYPSCLQMAGLSPGDWCVWPTEVPAANYSAATK